MKAADSKKTIMNKIKKFAESQDAEYREVKDAGNLNIVYLTISFSNYKLVFDLNRQECYKERYGNYVFFTDEELKFLDLLDFEITKNHYEELKQNVTDWYGKKQ